MSWEWLAGLLPFLLLLACPIAMWFMMRGMSHDHGRGSSKDGSDADAAEAALRREVETLRTSVAELEASNRGLERMADATDGRQASLK